VWALVGILAWMGGDAHAGPFTQKTSQGPALGPQVTRPHTMPKGWLELGLRADTKRSTQHRTASGKVVDHDGVWRSSHLWLDVRQGFSKQVTLYASVPWVMAQISPVAGTTTTTTAMGDAHIGVLAEPWRWERAGLGWQLDMKAPSGVEWPGSTSSGPDQVRSMLTGTGVANYGAHLLGRWQPAARALLRTSAGYIAKPASVVGYVVQDDGFGNGWLDPGDEWLLDAEATVQVHTTVALSGGTCWSRRGTYAMGVSGPGTRSRSLDAIADSAGAFLDGRLGMSWAPTSHWELQAQLERSLAGSDTQGFAHLGLEEFSPQPGNELSLSVAARW
jgi:hypothetical protein